MPLKTLRKTTSVPQSGSSGAPAPTTQTDPLLDLQKKAGNKAVTKALGDKGATGGTTGTAKTPEPAKKQTMEAKDAESAFAVLAPVLNVLLPSGGTSAKLDVEFRIPVKGGMITLHLTGTAARESDSSFKLGIEAAVGGGMHIGVATAKAEFGGYLETRGPDAKGALTLASWTLFRSMLAESTMVPQEIVEALYATKTQSSGAWDKAVRETYLKKGSANYGEIGVVGSAEASGGVKGVASGSVGVKAKLGRLYDAESIERREGATSTSQKLLGALGLKRGAQASLGDRMLTIITTATVEAASGIGGGSLTVTTAIRQEKDKRGGKETTKYVLDTLSVDGTAHTKLIPLDAIASVGGAGGAMVTKIVQIVEAAKKAVSKAEQQAKKTEQEQPGSSVGDVLWSLASFKDGLETALTQAGSIDISIPHVLSSGQLHVVGGMVQRKPKLSVGIENLMKIEMPDLVVARASFERVERVGSIEYADSKWVVHFGDLEKELAAKDEKKKKASAPVTAPPPPPPTRSRSNAVTSR